MDLLNTWSSCWAFGLQLQGMWWAGASEPAHIERLQHSRLRALVAHARARSPFYRRLYRDLPEPTPADPGGWPSVKRATLMRHFDDWVTDPAVRLADLRRFIADPARVGERYLGRYVVWTSSGSTGQPGIYVQDASAMAVYDALAATRTRGPRPGEALAALASGSRLALVTATGGHFAGIVAWERTRRTYPWLARSTCAISVLSPMHDVVARLNACQPSIVASYPTTLLLLARERAARRLRISPQALWSGGENLTTAERAQIESSFACPVVDGYGASECMNIAFECERGALHLNSDWVLLEPVDEAGRAVPEGEPSSTVLLTNLANQVQPLIRYDLGDSVSWLRACPCGSAFPALRVSGRRDDIVTLHTASGARIALPPLALATALEEGAGVHRFQIEQTGPRTLRVRFEPPTGQARASAWGRIRASLHAYLQAQGLGRVALREDPAAVSAHPVTGKLRTVLGLGQRPRVRARIGSGGKRLRKL